MINAVVSKDWDSDFFGFKVGSVTADDLDKEAMDSIVKMIVAENYKLVYFFVSPDDEPSNCTIKKAGAYLADQKVVFENTFTRPAGDDGDDDIIPFSAKRDFKMAELEDIALQSGQYSRFNTDENISKELFKKMYGEWLKKSLSHEIADEVLIYIEEGQSGGLITLGVKDNCGNIGLLAVDSHLRGKSIGRRLVNAGINYFLKRNIQKIDVVTQLENENACIFYKKVGFQQKSVTNIYHYYNSGL